MGLLDRLKPQPRWKHADPMVRMAGVQELPEDDQDLLAKIAREDSDPRVRRLAVSKLGSVAVLAETVKHDADTQVREEAAGVLLDIALGAYDANEAASLAAVDGLTGLVAAEAQKQLILIAKAARLENVARAALDRVGADPRALGTIARRSEHPAIRLEALQHLDDPQEIVATASKSDHKDVALAALERVEDAEALRAIAARGKSPAAQRRARSLVRALDDRAAAAAEEEAKRLAALEARRQAQRELCRTVESLVAPSDWKTAATRVAEAESCWRGFGDDVDPDLQRRFEEAGVAARDALARHEAEVAERQREERERAAQSSRRTSVCAAVEALTPEEVETSLPALRAQWESLPGTDTPQLQARFDAACRVAEDRARLAGTIASRLADLEALCGGIEALGEKPEFPRSAELRAEWKTFRERWREVTDIVRNDPRAGGLFDRWSAAEARLRSREAAAREDRAREAREAEARTERAAQALEALKGREDVTLRALEHALRTARAAAEDLERLGPSPERNRLRQHLEDAQSAMLPRVQELRDIDDWQRWANAAVQEELCQRMEALRTIDDPARALHTMRELLAEWQKVAVGPKERGQALWRRFAAARDAVRLQTEAFVADQARQRADNLQRKHALCERAEMLAESSDWIPTAEAIKALQAEWKTIGPGPRRAEQAAWERFRAACDRFFSRRQADLAERRQAWSSNLVRKEELCARAEALADSDDWEPVAAEIRRLQVEWKTIGPVRRSKSEAIWKRFHGACDRFFERYKLRHETDLAARRSAREALVAEMESLAQASAGSDGSAPSGADRLTAMRALRNRWEASPPLPRQTLAPLHERVEAALAGFAREFPDVIRGSELDIDANIRRLEELCVRTEQLTGSEEDSGTSTPAAILAKQLREALAANTIGGRADPESRRRELEHEARQLQAAWARVGFVPESLKRPLGERFRNALRRAEPRERERHDRHDGRRKKELHRA